MPGYMRTLEIQPRVRYEDTAASIIQEIVHDGDAVVPINVPTILTKTRDAKAAEAKAKIRDEIRVARFQYAWLAYENTHVRVT